MAESLEELERRIDRLRAEVRQVVVRGDRVRARALRAELRSAEHAWEGALADIEDQATPVEVGPSVSTPRSDGSLLPLREQVHQALTLLTVPAAPKLIVAVHEAFSVGQMLGTRLTSLRRDEERSFTASPYARPYYICSALTADLLGVARGLLAISTWRMEQRIVGPLSHRVDFLTAAVAVAEHVGRLPDPAPGMMRLLWRFAANIPGAAGSIEKMRPDVVARAAGAELEIHASEDAAQRTAAANRARKQLSDVEQFFGNRLHTVGLTAVKS